MKYLRTTFLWLLAAPLAAQMTVLLPSHAELADGHSAVAMPFGRPGFRTQLLVDATAVARNGSVVTGLAMRTDRTSLPLTATTVPNVTISLSHSTRLVGAMSDRFADNITEVPVVVFQGTVQLPGRGSGHAGPLPWDVGIALQVPFAFTAANGQLLIDVVGNNPPGGAPVYWLDAMAPGGSATVFGTRGNNATGDALNLIVATGNSLDPRLLTIGRTIDYTSALSFSNPPGVLAIGTAPQPNPVDLGAIGAPANFLYVDPIVLVPHAWTRTFIGWSSTFQLNLPNLRSLLHGRVYAQSTILEPRANALGLALSEAIETRIGDPLEVLPVQQLDADDPAAATGTRLDFGFGGPPTYGAVALRLEGIFF